MKKKAKIALNLSAIALVLGTIAQFYTNYKIDQTLQQFPYHFREHFTIQVDEKNSDFFTRDLTFSFKHKDDKEHTEFIQTKLIALPFAITAQSEIPTALIKKLNQELNITIDKNTINSQFSVVGDYLKSDIVTDFRDSTNTAQKLETELTYSSKSGFVEIVTDLTGLNYDANTKIKGVSGEYLLKPVGQSLYDIEKASTDINNIDIALLNGDNTRFELEKTNYSLNKYIDAKGYDLTTKFKTQSLKVSNKNTKSEQGKAKFEGIEFNTKQLAVPSHVTFYDQLSDFNVENLNLKQVIRQITDSLFNNDQFEASFSIKTMSIPENEKNMIDLKNAGLSITFNNQQKEDAELKSKFNLEEITVTQKEQPLSIKGINWEYGSSHFNLVTHLNLLNKYLPENLNELKQPEKDNPEFVADFKQLIDNYKNTFNMLLNIKSIDYPGYFSAENLALNYTEEPINQESVMNSSLSADKLVVNRENVQFEQFNLTLPIKAGPTERIYPLFLCGNNAYALLCMNNLSAKTYEKWQKELFAKLHTEINQANLAINVDTFPPTNKQQINGKLAINVQPIKEQNNAFPLFEMISQADISAELTVPIALISDMALPEPSESAKLKQNSQFWKETYQVLNQAGEQLKDFNLIQGEQYQFNLEQKGGKVFLNGKDLDSPPPQPTEPEPPAEQENNQSETPVVADAAEQPASGVQQESNKTTETTAPQNASKSAK